MSKGLAKALAIALALFFVAIFLPAPAFAERGRMNSEKELEDVKKRLRETEKSIDELTKSETSILGLLDGMNKELNKSRRDIKVLDRSIITTKNKVRSTGKKIEALKDEKVLIRRRLEERLTAIYKMRGAGLFRVVFSADSSASGARNYKYMAMIMDADNALIDEAEVNIKNLEAERLRLEKLKASLGDSKKLASIAKKRGEGRLSAKKKVLSDARKKKANYLKMAAELEAAKTEVENLLKRLRTQEEYVPIEGSFAKSKGRLAMPVRGEIYSSYGKVVHKKFNTETFNNGIVIEASYGEEVRNLFVGRVLYVGWLKGYGQVIIIDHGLGYYTLFAHLSEIFRKKGESLKIGDIIGLVGDSGPHEVAGLYFEIRHKGAPKDPEPWFASR